METHPNKESIYMETDHRHSKLSTVFNSKDPILITQVGMSKESNHLFNAYSGEFET